MEPTPLVAKLRAGKIGSHTTISFGEKRPGLLLEESSWLNGTRQVLSEDLAMTDRDGKIVRRASHPLAEKRNGVEVVGGKSEFHGYK